MPKEKKLTQDELESIGKIQQANQQVMLEFGRIEIMKKRLDEQRSEVDKKFEEVKKQEQELLDKLRDKYDNGSIDLNRGVFTPSAESEDEPVTAFDE